MTNSRKSFLCAFLAMAMEFSGASLGAANDPADAAMQSIRPEAIRAGMRFLSDDSLEGRGTGERGHEIAAKYMASEFEAMGLTPAGEAGTYFQRVPLRSARVDMAKTLVDQATPSYCEQQPACGDEVSVEHFE